MDPLTERLKEYDALAQRIVGMISANCKENVSINANDEAKSSKDKRKEKKSKRIKLMAQSDLNGDASVKDDAGSTNNRNDDPWGRKVALKKKKAAVETTEKKKELMQKLHEKIESYRAKRDQEKMEKRKKMRESKRARREHNQKHGNNLLVKGSKKKSKDPEELEASIEEIKEPITDTSKTSQSAIVENGKFIYSKFDLISPGEGRSDANPAGSRKVKLKKNLHDIRRKEKLVGKLVEEGKVDKAISLKEKSLWKNALDRSEGTKVKDDADKIVRTLKRQDKLKKRHGKKWSERKQQVEEKMDKKQDKRQRNINNKREEKKKRKKKLLRKKGRIFD